MARPVRRFLTGVLGCEVTGVVTTPDQRTMFVNIQHPGDVKPSQWPHMDGLTRRDSATVVVTKDDGGVIGSYKRGRRFNVAPCTCGTRPTAGSSTSSGAMVGNAHCDSHARLLR